jgi:hypothetical protein
VQNRAKSCKIVQNRAKSCKIVQNRAKSCKIVQNRASSCKLVQARAKSCETPFFFGTKGPGVSARRGAGPPPSRVFRQGERPSRRRGGPCLSAPREARHGTGSPGEAFEACSPCLSAAAPGGPACGLRAREAFEAASPCLSVVPRSPPAPSGTARGLALWRRKGSSIQRPPLPRRPALPRDPLPRHAFQRWQRGVPGAPRPFPARPRGRGGAAATKARAKGKAKGKAAGRKGPAQGTPAAKEDTRKCRGASARERGPKSPKRRPGSR